MSEKLEPILPKIELSSVNYSTIKCDPTGRTINNIAENLNKIFPHNDIKTQVVPINSKRSNENVKMKFKSIKKITKNRGSDLRNINLYGDEYSQVQDSSFDEYNSIFENSQLLTNNCKTTAIKRKSTTHFSKKLCHLTPTMGSRLLAKQRTQNRSLSVRKCSIDEGLRLRNNSALLALNKINEDSNTFMFNKRSLLIPYKEHFREKHLESRSNPKCAPQVGFNSISNIDGRRENKFDNFRLTFQ